MLGQLIALIPSAVSAVKSVAGLFKSEKIDKFEEIADDVVELVEDAFELKDDVEALKKEFD